MGYVRIEAVIKPAIHRVSICEGYNSLAVKQAFANVPDTASLKSIYTADDGVTIIEFEE